MLIKSVAVGLLFVASSAAAQDPDSAAFVREVDRRLGVPAAEQEAYAHRLESALAQASVAESRPQYYVLVDRSPRVQAAFIYWRAEDSSWRFIGASPVSTGRPGEFEHFLTPIGVFEHSLANLDFRAEGTRNANGILGYGRQGMRVFDFGWVRGERTWGQRGTGDMRLQMHATDPGLLEPLLGVWHSKGCIRIPATLDVFIDRHGLLDADYEAAVRAGQHFWELRADRKPTPWPGRWLVVVDSLRAARPAWSPLPSQRLRKPLATSERVVGSDPPGCADS